MPGAVTLPNSHRILQCLGHCVSRERDCKDLAIQQLLVQKGMSLLQPAKHRSCKTKTFQVNHGNQLMG